MTEENLRLQISNDLTGHLSMLPLREQIARLGRSWGWFLAAGIGSIILGIIAFNWPVTSSVGLTFALGILFVISGLMHFIQSFRLRHENGNAWRFFQSLAALAAGLLMLRYPASGMVGVAIAMTFYFFVSAFTKGAFALGMRPHKGWGWGFASAIASFLIGVYIIATLPVSALWVPGLLLGIDFVIYGAALIGLSLSLKNIHRRIGTKLNEAPYEEKRAS